MTYQLTATYIKFIEIDDDEDLDSVLDDEFGDLPDKVGTYKDWDSMSGEWERISY